MTDYHRYMASREWRVKRRETFTRAGGVCERCWGAPASQVHHLTYERLGRERPEDLMAICREDHEYLSAVTDLDPVAAIPALTSTISDPFSRSLVKLVEYSEYAEGWPDRNPGADPELIDNNARWVRAQTGFLIRHVRRWLEESRVSLPERQFGIANASMLWSEMCRESDSLARVGATVLGDRKSVV